MTEQKHTNKYLKLKPIEDVDGLKKRVLTWGFYGAVGFAGYKFVLAPVIQKMKRQHAEGAMMTDPNMQQAAVLHNAMNTSGIKWMRSIDQTNEKEIYEAARKITNWKEVQKTYRKLYNRDLLSDLQSELDTEEYQTFIRILSQTKSGNASAGSQNTLKGKLIATSKDVRLRSTPDSSKGVFSFDSNILATAKARTFLGWATGKQQVDNKGVKYLEVMIRLNQEIPEGAIKKIYEKQNSRILRFWVGAGAIHLFNSSAHLVNNGIKIYQGATEVGLMGTHAGW